MVNSLYTKEMVSFLNEVTDEHYRLTQGIDNNINYLWYMYSLGTKRGIYNSFILHAEINLNTAMSIITEDEQKNLVSMIDSPDSENVYLAFLALSNLRKERHKKFGSMAEFPEYMEIRKDYLNKVMSPELFVRKMRKNE